MEIKKKKRKAQKAKKSRITIIAILIWIISIAVIIIVPSVYQYICKSREHEDLASKIDDEVLKANVCIIAKEHIVTTESDSISYSEGASGVIIGKEGKTYYVLTAYHIVSDIEGKEYGILLYGEQTYKEYKDAAGKWVPYDNYYDRLPKAEIVDTYEEYDLAVISFETEADLNVLEISDDAPEHGDRIVTIGNPDKEHFVQTYGKVTSKKLVEFDTHDEIGTNMVLKHNAYVASGSSGSAILNENMEIVGINIGGGEDFLGRFRSGAMIPCDNFKELVEGYTCN